MECTAIIVGAGPAGLACAASLKALGIDATVVEKDSSVGPLWRRHYDRLHLHTDRDHSGLPGLAMSRSLPVYPSRSQFVEYLDDYAQHFKIKPVFGATANEITRRDLLWRVATSRGLFTAPIIVVATGLADFPLRPSWPGLDTFGGHCLHSSEYRNPTPFVGKRVLVVGFGNSGGEIALDLASAGIETTISVRGPVQILPRDLLGLPILTWAIAQQHLPARLVDFVNAPIIRLAIGPVGRYGLQRAKKGPRRMIEEDGRVPLLDIGTMAKIRDGSIKVLGAIDCFTHDGIRFMDHRIEKFDAVILATGFRPDLRKLLPKVNGVLNGTGQPLVTGSTTNEVGLFFCGQTTSATGQLRQIGLEATRIAALASRDLIRLRNQGGLPRSLN